jgi:hypothetical protein
MEYGWCEGKETILALRGPSNCCRLPTRGDRPDRRFTVESPPRARRIRYNVRLLRSPAS